MDIQIGTNLHYKEKVENKFNNKKKLKDYDVDWKRIYRCVECFSWNILLQNPRSEDEALVSIESGADLYYRSNDSDDWSGSALDMIVRNKYRRVITLMIDRAIENPEDEGYMISILTDLIKTYRYNKKVMQTLINHPDINKLLGEYICVLNIDGLIRSSVNNNDIKSVQTLLNMRREYVKSEINNLCESCSSEYQTIIVRSNSGESVEKDIKKMNTRKFKCNVKGSKCCLRSILDYNGNLIEDVKLNDALEYACENSNLEIIKLLLAEEMLDPSVNDNESIKYIHKQYKKCKKEKKEIKANIISLLLYHPKVWNKLSPEEISIYEAISGVAGG